VTQLLQAEMESGSALAPVIAGAMAMRRAVPLEAVLEVLHRAVRRSVASRFILDGFPRAVSLGFPSVHDQVFALEARIGPIRGCIGLVASEAVRVERAGAKTPGEVAAVREKVATFLREKQPVLNFFAGVGKAVTIDSGAKPPGDVYEAARPFLE
jgi:adenylate kinase family enzyme